MRLLLVSQDFPPEVGGTQTYAFELARRWARWCEDFAVLAPRVPGAAATDAGQPFEVIRPHASHDTLGLKALVPLLTSMRGRFDAAFHVQWSAALGAMLARPLGGPPRVFVAAHGRELLFEPWRHRPGLQPLYDLVRRTVLRQADGLFPVSRYTAGLLREAGAATDRIEVVHNGTDPQHFRPLPAAESMRRQLGVEGRRVLFTVSRLVRRKGIDTVLRALPLVARAVPDVCYLVGGDGPDRQRLEDLAASLHVSEHVCFLGRIAYEDLPRYYNACDVFAMPSRQTEPDVEGFGIVFLEAGACGKPVVGARSGGVPDAVRDGVTGRLVEPDDVDALAAVVVDLLLHPEKAERLGAAGRARVRREGTWDVTARTLLESMRRRL